MKYKPTLFKEDFMYDTQYYNALGTAELVSESKSIEALEELVVKDSDNNIYKHALYLKTNDADWWKNEDTFPCMLIANHDSGNALVWVHYQIDGYAYDVKDNKYRLTECTNWKRATKQEILDNIKGL